MRGESPNLGDMTEAELHLWSRLENHAIMRGWKSQYELKPYTLDFYTPQARLCVEADGYHHWNEQRQLQHDWKRERFLTRNKIVTVRFSNKQILERTDYVVGEILGAYLKWIHAVNGPEIEWYRLKAQSVR